MFSQRPEMDGCDLEEVPLRVMGDGFSVSLEGESVGL